MVKTTTSAIEIDSFGVIHNTFKTRSAFKSVYVLEQATAIRLILNGKKAPIIVNAIKVDQVKLSQYSKLLSFENLENASAMAILVNSTLQKELLNFWYTMSKKTCPLRVFTDKDQANSWLQTYV